MDAGQFIRELKSRKVYRTAAVYCAGAWALLQIADVIFPMFGLPDWSVTAVLVIAALGFPIALVLSWLFELTPDGDSGREQSAGDGSFPMARVFELTLIVLLCGLVGYLYVGRLSESPVDAGGATVAEASIAVLPFVNLSDDAELEYLGDGLAEEILNLLAKLNELNVAARTSSFYFKDKSVDIQTVGSQLGVAHVLEGSVRVAGDRVRVTAQLIRSDNGFHLWSDTFDRDVDDVLEFQDEIAAQVVDHLQILLSNESRDTLARNSQVDPEGYKFYLRARAYLRSSSDPEKLGFAVELFNRTIEVNPDYADAYAGKCEALLGIYEEARDNEMFTAAEASCQRALTLDRRAPSVYVALGQLYVASGQYPQAMAEFDTALALKPSLVEAELGRGNVYLKQGDYEKSEARYRAALAQQPDHWRAQMAMGNFLFLTGRVEEAIPFYQHIADLMPDNSGGFNNLGAAYFMTGEYQRAVDAWEISLTQSATGVTYANLATSYYFMGEYDQSIPLYHKAVELSPEDYELWGNLGDAYRYSSEGREMSAPMYERAIAMAEARLQVNANDASTLAMVAHYQAALGRREEALATLEKVRALPSADITVSYSMATTLASLGEPEEAMTALETALDGGFPMHMVLADANLKSLKDLPRFESATAHRN